MKNINKVGVVGAGTMGAALAQKFAQEGFDVVLADREKRFVDKGISGIKNMLEEGVKRNVFTPEMTDNIVSRIHGTEDLNHLSECDIVIEAIFEDFQAKKDLFSNLCNILPPDAIIATNTSSFSVTELGAAIVNPSRFIGLHYFFHAAKNRLVEIIPGEKTSSDTVKSVQRFCIKSGKDPIFTKDAYGFAVNRFFVPWLNEAVKILEERIATIDEIDTVCMKTFGIGMGPFALMNATGVPIALHAQKTLEFFGPSYKVSKRLEEQVATNENWKTRSTDLEISAIREKQVADRMLGCTFFVSNQILEEEVCSAIDLNKGAKIGLRWRRGPVDLMLLYGLEKVKDLIRIYADRYHEKVPVLNNEMLEMEFVTLDKQGDRAIITFNRPEDLNALNEEVIQQLGVKFDLANNDPEIKTIFITGSGKAFVAGADIKFFIKNIKQNSIDKIVEFTRIGQGVYNKIDNSPKTVVALLNGMALGGGMELALCADFIYAVPKVQIAFPETGIGIYPGLGGTQRTTKKVGKALSKYLILTGKMHTAIQATEIGLIDGVISNDELFDLMDGKIALPGKHKIELNEQWKSIEELFESTHYSEIIQPDHGEIITTTKDLEKLAKIMKSKAPVAMKYADKLIDEARGTESELELLSSIFTTSDALLGLSSIGKKVEYQGN